MEQIESRIDHRRAKIVGTIVAIHFLLSVALFFLMMVSSNSRFEGGGPSDLTQLLLNSAFEVSSVPLLKAFFLLKIANTGMWTWLVFFANSVLWGWVGWKVVRLWRSRLARGLASA